VEHLTGTPLLGRLLALLANIRPGARIIKLFTAVKKSVMYKASVFVIVHNFLLALTNTLALYIRELITAEKRFMIQAPGR
jgi:hypothetical protein